MKDKDYGILLSKIDYSETSYILKLFTAKGGLSSFLYKGAKKKKEQFKLFPLSIVEIEYGINPKSDLYFLNSISTYVNISNCFFDPIKSSMLFFLNELVQKTLNSSEPDQDVLSFIIGRLKYLDVHNDIMNFHLQFMIDFSKFLGFHPGQNVQSFLYFDMKEAEFCPIKPKHEYFIEGSNLKAFETLIASPIEPEGNVDLKSVKRSDMLQILLRYYRLQLEGFGECKTIEVLQTILND